MKKHRKKKIAAVSVAGLLAMAMGFWSDIYPVVCQRVNDPQLCIALSMGALKQGGLDTGFKLDAGGTNDAGQ